MIMIQLLKIIQTIIRWKANFLIIKVVVINHGISLQNVVDDDGGGGFPEFPKWSDMASKLVRYGFQSVSLWNSVLKYRTTLEGISDHFGNVNVLAANDYAVATAVFVFVQKLANYYDSLKRSGGGPTEIKVLRYFWCCSGRSQSERARNTKQKPKHMSNHYTIVARFLPSAKPHGQQVVLWIEKIFGGRRFSTILQ